MKRQTFQEFLERRERWMTPEKAALVGLPWIFNPWSAADSCQAHDQNSPVARLRTPTATFNIHPGSHLCRAGRRRREF